MPRSRRSLQLTDQYRRRLLLVKQNAERQSEAAWRNVDLADYERSFSRWLGVSTTVVSRAQLLATRASLAYLAAFLASELGRRARTPTIDTRKRVGVSRDGRDLRTAYDTVRIGVLAALKDGRPNDEALKAGWDRARRAIDMDVMQAGRETALEGIDRDPRFKGFRRAVSGTCGACLAVSADEIHFEVHENCECVTEPVVQGVPDEVPRLTGFALFSSMGVEHQDEALGEEAAALVRSGAVPLHKLVQRSPMKTEDDWITQRPVKALVTPIGGSHG